MEYAGQQKVSVTSDFSFNSVVFESAWMSWFDMLEIRGRYIMSKAPRLFPNSHSPLIDAAPKVSTSLDGSQPLASVLHANTTMRGIIGLSHIHSGLDSGGVAFHGLRSDDVAVHWLVRSRDTAQTR